ncbi:hypothetical protein QUA74_13475 [Microcoleus sp. LAD1_D3]|uniref:hypothetical protein n=1 Tax=Microcoleus sp. LAD1_D3 TaxID=2819365 RepID=UPI002FD18F13
MDALAYQTNRLIYDKVDLGKMPDITQDDGWKEIWAIVGPNESWLEPAKCSEIQERLSIFNQSHIKDRKHIDNVMKALSIGFHLTKAAVEWDNPVAGNTLPNDPSTANARGIQWQLVMAYGGFESVTKTLMNLRENNSGLSIADVQDFTSKCNLPDYIPLIPPNTDRKDLEKWLTKLSTETPETGDELLNFLGLKHGDRNLIKDWLVNSNPIEDWANATRLAKALRNATAHGALSPTKVKKWGLKPAMEILVKNLGDLVVFGLQTLASPRV